MPKFLIIFLSAVLTLNAQANSFLFASGVNNTKIPPTAIIQNTCATHSGGGGAVSSAGTCDHYGSELVFYNDEINSISGLNISTDYQPSNNINTDYPDFPQSVTMSRDEEIVTMFSYTGAMQTYLVPAGVNSITIEAWGAKGGESNGSGTYGLIQAGQGGYATGELSVTSGQMLYIYVGGQGNINVTYQSISAGGWNGGGDGWGGWSGNWNAGNGTSGGGGGASDVRAGGTTLNDRIIVAGGGGGSDSWATGRWGGDGGGLTGSTSGGGATGGTQSAGGASNHGNATDGSFGQGGDGYTSSSQGHGTGGGGGYYGGGGGQHSGAGGGGGSSYIGGVTNGSTISGGREGHGQVVISYTEVQSNTAPTATAQSVTSNEDSPQTITLTGSDVEGDALTYALATNPSNGTSTLSGSQVTYTPNTNYNGSDSFTFTVSDAEYTSSAATVSITVASVNDLPVISSTPALDALDGSLYEYSISVNDIDGDVVAITATGPNWLTVNDNILSGTPSPSDGGLHQIVLSANDGNGGVVTQSYTLAVSLHSLVITGESGYRIFSSPVSGIIYGDLLDELWTQGAEGSDSPNSNPNIWTYGNGWNSVTDFSSDALTAGKGFLMYIFADIDFDGDDDLNDPENPVIISIDGAQQESGVSVVSEPSGWNLIGNPYGLSVDISQMLSDNNGTFNSTIYALDHTNPGYKTHNGVVGNIENDEIKPFDGFWIKADADGNVFEFTEQSILKGSLNNAGRTTTDDSNGSAVFTFTNGDYSSSTYLSFTPEGEINLDPADAYRLVPMSPAEHLSSMIHESGKSLSINNLPLDLSSDISFPMDVMMLSPTEDGYETQAEQVNLSWDVTNLPAGITLELNNNITGQNINLTGYPSANINLPSKGGFSTSGDFMATYPVVGQSQFTLSVYGTLAAVEDDVLPERLTLHSAYPNPFNPSTLIRFDLSNADMVSLDIFDIAGKQVASLISEYMTPGSHQINWNPGNLSSGLYLVNLVVGTETFNQKITFIK
ncbi:glycine-rich protein [Candidatus Marinimicrobia bacterium]|nr:glycine-rich protein [Candidatus Neomarinimicrobiota bacterium]